jgi:Tfp pilus assembly protein PilO
MGGAPVNTLLARLRAAVEELGQTGVAGIALLGFAVALYASAIAPLADELTGLRAEADDLQRRLQPGSGRGAAGSPAEQLATFYAFFPAPQSSPDWLGRINAAAKSQGLVLRSGEYRLDRTADQKLARYQITLPVVGSYGQIRGFVAQVLAEVPAAALEEITLRRESVSSPTLEARIRLTLYLRSA